MFYKILPANLLCDGVVHQLGLNEKTFSPFSDGMFYQDLEHAMGCLCHGTLIAEVEPKGKIQDNSSFGFYRTDKLYVHTITPIADWFENQPDSTKQYIQTIKKAFHCYDHCQIQLHKNPTEEQQITAVNHSGWSIRFIANPSDKAKLAAIGKDYTAIQCIENPTEEMKWLSIEKDAFNIRSIKDPSEEMKLKAVNKKGQAIVFIDDPSEQVQIAAVENDWYSMSRIKNPSEVVQLAAVRTYWRAIDYIENPTLDVQLESNKQRTLSLEPETEENQEAELGQ